MLVTGSVLAGLWSLAALPSDLPASPQLQLVVQDGEVVERDRRAARAVLRMAVVAVWTLPLIEP